MNKRLKTKWVKALRSGKYEQTTGVLKDTDGFCCLGLLRHLIYPTSRRSDDEEEILHPRHAEKCGLERGDQQLLAELNDGNAVKGIQPHTFEEIADHIEKNL